MRRRCSARSLPASPTTQPRPGSAKGTERFCFSAGVRLKGQRVNPKTRTASSRAVAWGERTHNARRYATLPGRPPRRGGRVQARPRAAWRCLAAAVTSSKAPDSPRTATVGRSFAAATTKPWACRRATFERTVEHGKRLGPSRTYDTYPIRPVCCQQPVPELRPRSSLYTTEWQEVPRIQFREASRPNNRPPCRFLSGLKPAIRAIC